MHAAVVSESSQVLLAQKSHHIFEAIESELMSIVPSHCSEPSAPRAPARSGKSNLCPALTAFSHSQLPRFLNILELPKQIKRKAQKEQLFALVSGQLSAPFPKTGFLPY